MSAKTLEGRIVAALFEDLRDRRGLKWVFQRAPGSGRPVCGWIPHDTQDAIRTRWRSIIRKAIEEDRRPE